MYKYNKVLAKYYLSFKCKHSKVLFLTVLMVRLNRQTHPINVYWIHEWKPQLYTNNESSLTL